MAKRPRDPNQLAKLIVDIATGEAQDTASESKRKPKNKRRAGGLKGGKARAQRLTPQEREDIARLAARARWKKTD
ncbi:MAG: histone H1 [Acidobacteria bacterium]|nr:MAG: histone H1 [Acidobacteriota bacterium]